MIALENIEARGATYRVALRVPVAGRTRRVIVTLLGQSVLDVQADDGIDTWTSSAGDSQTTDAAVSRALEEVARLRVLQKLVGGRR